MSVEFARMIDDSRANQLLEMMHDLYSQEQPDPANQPTAERFASSIQFLLTNPERGQIILFIDQHTILGYAILIPYWSNEFGGTLLFVDELFVIASQRSRGIGRNFFDWLLKEKPFSAVACALEVNPGNPRAKKFYESIGFEPRTYTMMTKDFSS